MTHQYKNLGDTVYFAFASNDTSGSGNDGASAVAKVRKAGATASDAPIHSVTPTLLSHADYAAGCYEVAVDATSGNGFVDTGEYLVFSTLAVDSQNPAGFIGSFSLKPVIANAVQWLSQAVTLSTGNKPDVNIDEFKDDAQTASDLKDFADAGYDPVTHKVTEVATLTGHTAQTADNNVILAHADYGLAKLVRSTVPANTLDVAATGEAGLDFDNIKDAASAHTLTNITVPVATDVTNRVESDLVYIHGSALTETAGQLAAAFVKLFDVATPALVASDVMRGTDGANTTVPDAAGTAATPADVATALSTYDGPTKAEMDTAFTEIKGSTWSDTSDTLEDIRDKLTDIETDVAAVPTVTEIKTKMEEANGNLDQLMEALVYQLIIDESTGDAELFNVSNVSQGTIAAAFTSTTGYTKRKKMII